MSFFGKNDNTETNIKSYLGRPITSIALATKELHSKQPWQDPRPMIDFAVTNKKTFYGLTHSGDEIGKPFFLNEDDVTHEIFIGTTGGGKGVALGNKAKEAILKKKGLIVIDPKQDAFLPRIIYETLRELRRENDLQVCYWPTNFGYMGINEGDTYLEIANKLIIMLGLEPVSDPGADYYRRNGRVLLKKILRIFFEGDLGIIVKKNFLDILVNLRNLKEDLEKQAELQKEISKVRPNANLIEKFKKRHFSIEKIEAIYWDTTSAETLDGLSKALSEVAEGAIIHDTYKIQSALYEGKILYIRADLLDIASLAFLKIILADAIQNAKKKEANTLVICDEVPLYANQMLSIALSTVRSMGLKFILALQDESQLDESIRAAILSNSNAKFYYKTSDKETLESIKVLGGNELVTKYSDGGDGGAKITQETEDLLNTTRIRALPRTEVGILVAEALPAPVLIRTCFVPVEEKFDWSKYEFAETRKLEDIKEKEKGREEKFKIKIEEKKLLENSDLWNAVSFSTDTEL